MKFKFPLQKVLDHRKIKENLAQKDFQEALSILLDLENKLKHLENQSDEARVRAFKMQTEGGTAGPGLTQVDEFIRNQKILIQMQQAKIAQQEKIVEEKRELLRQAMVETKIIATFKEKKFEEFKRQVEADDQKEMDEQSVLRFKSPDKKEIA